MELDHLGLIAVTGADAASFLQNQLTAEVQSLGPNEARLAGLCSTKGRLLATFLCWRNESGFTLQIERELLAPTLKHLGRYVLRAKAKLEDVTGQFSVFGLAGNRREIALKARFEALPGVAWAIESGPAGTLIRVPDSVGLPRWLWIAPRGPNEPQPDDDGGPNLADSSIWRWLEIRAGLPHVTAATQDRFVPQMINFEALGGVSFKKGCYPGQEIVARSQYLGKLKRRTTVARTTGDAGATGGLAGSDVVMLDGEKAGEPVGAVVNAEASPHGGIDMLVELPLATAALPSGIAVTVSGGGAIPIEVLGLPYTLPDQEIFVRPKL
jgi:folate-binding protein YgfZ